MYDWNDLRHFLAVARTGSTLAASRELKVSQATVSRRVTVFEEALGLKLFVRRPSGYTLSPRGEALLPLAEAVEGAALALSNGVAAEARRLSGIVRLTTVESAANTWVIPALARLRQSQPAIHVEVITADRYLDLARGEADLAIRFGARPEQESLVVRHLTDLEEAFYASRDTVVRLGRPCNFAEIARYPLVSDAIAGAGRIAQWVADTIPGAETVHRVSTVSGLVAAVRAGMGAAVLPCIIGDSHRDLVRLLPPVPELSFPCWLVTTDAIRRQPHVRAVIDVVSEEIQLVINRQKAAQLDALSA
jgi:DNA-binding transcriptional LysR family regulator